MKREARRQAISIGRQIATARRRVRLSQKQLATLLMTEARCIRRWESGKIKAPARQVWFVCLFLQYAANEGTPAFLERFVKMSGRYSKRGRPTRK
jgi:transcriptional regulator with XRE-family HTH domain